MELDIRAYEPEKITVIRFADDEDDSFVASGIALGFSGVVEVGDIGEGRRLGLFSEEHARNLIKALNKAIELGWFKE